MVVTQWPCPDAVRSQASGIGVIWLSSFRVNQVCEYAPLIVMVTVYLPDARTELTSPGSPFGLAAAHPYFECQLGWIVASIMFIQNTTSWASTDSPLDHW